MATLQSIKKNDYMKMKGLYIISTNSLSRKYLYKVGYSGSSLVNRLNQIREVLSPPLFEELKVYALIVPKSKWKSGEPMNVRALELRQMEKDVHEASQQWKQLVLFPDTKRKSEIKEDNLNELFDALQDVINNPHETSRIHFKLLKFK